MCANTGYTWDQAGKLTIPRLKALMRYWQRHPPAHLLIAAFLGYKGGGDQPSQASSEALDMMVAQAPSIKGLPKLDTSAWSSRHQKEPQDG